MTKEPRISAATEDLLMAEVENEAAGGASPATLESALDSLDQGYVPWICNADDYPVDDVREELSALAARFGNCTPVESVLDRSAWQRRASRGRRRKT